MDLELTQAGDVPEPELAAVFCSDLDGSLSFTEHAPDVLWKSSNG